MGFPVQLVTAANVIFRQFLPDKHRFFVEQSQSAGRGIYWPFFDDANFSAQSLHESMLEKRPLS